MAPLTWKNVDAPSFSGVNQALALAAQNFNSGMGAGIDALGSFQEGRTINDSNQLALDIMKYQDPAAYKAALMNGTVQAGVDPRNLNAEAINFMAGYEGKLVGNQQSDANLTGTNLNNTAQAFNNDQGVQAAARAAEQRAALPAAQARQAEIRALVDSGDPAKLAQARELQASSVGMFTTAGIDPLTVMSDTNSSFNAAMGQTKEIVSYGDFWKDRSTSETSDQLVTDLVQNSANPQDAILGAQQAAKDGFITPEILRTITSDIEANGSTYFANAPQSLADQILRPNAPGTAPAPTYVPNSTKSSDFITYENQGAKRNEPLSSELEQGILPVLSELGITVKVASGGQATKEEAAAGHGTRVGNTTNHDNGNAGDMDLYYQGRLLSWKNENDLPILQQMASRLKEQGIGVSAGDGYMGDNGTRSHIGLGTRTWGDTYSFDSAYPALKEIYGTVNSPNNSAPENRPQYQAMLDSVANKTDYIAPIDLNRSQINNADGTVSTEQTITTKIDDTWINIPTMVQGNPLTEQEAIDLFKSGQNPATGAFQKLEDAEAAAQTRSDTIGQMLDEVANGTPISPTTAPAVPIDVVGSATSSISEVSPTTDPDNPEFKLTDLVDRVRATSDINSAFNTSAPVNAAIANADNSTMIGPVATQVSKDTGLPYNAVIDAIQQIRETGLSPAAAGIIIADSIKIEDLTRKNMFGDTPIIDTMFGARAEPDRFGGATEGTSAPRVDMNKVASTIASYNKTGDASSGVNKMLSDAAAANVAPKAEKIAAAIADLDTKFLTLQAEGRATVADEQKYKEDREALMIMLNQVATSPAADNFIEATTPIQ
jgi:hypothetical protein